MCLIICIYAKHVQEHMRNREALSSVSVPLPPTVRSRLATLTEISMNYRGLVTNMAPQHGPWEKQGSGSWLEDTGAPWTLRVRHQHTQLRETLSSVL